MDFTGFDLAVLVIVGLAAVGGFLRGFVHEVLALGAWIAAIAAIYFLHEPLTAALTEFFRDNQTNAGLLAFVLLLLVPYAVMKLIARWAGGKSRDSLLGPIDRVLGLGFGVVKGAILVVLSFSILALGYDMAWGAEGRPDWIKMARSYPAVNSASKALVETISERQAELQQSSDSI
ncbi:colicin V production protein [Croceicoccus marinus]|uniref:Colicin V production protein n=2 Tax=Croceicoccus marinus TaxID=450378 RepID=A0A1Z1FBA5_9SPHN|nr:colicin V production protein [Croceicoccus marinus]